MAENFKFKAGASRIVEKPVLTFVSDREKTDSEILQYVERIYRELEDYLRDNPRKKVA